MNPALSHSASVASANASAASPAASPSQPGRSVALPSLFSRDPLSLSLSFALIDLPVALGQPYFPKELVRLVHDFASEPCIIVECAGSTFAGPAASKRTVFGTPPEFLRWLGSKLPPGFEDWWLDEEWVDLPRVRRWEAAHASALSECNSCLMDKQVQLKYADLSRLLHAQLEPHEYRMCVFDTQCDEDGCPFDPEEYIHEGSDGEEELPFDIARHRRFCLDQLDKRKAAITARGQEPVPVGMRVLLKRVRSSLLAGKLPHGLSPRPCDWAPLFRWIREFYVEWNKRMESSWLEEHEPGVRVPFEPPLCAVLLQQSWAGGGASITHQACLWSHDETRELCMRPADPIVHDEEADVEDEGQVAFGQESCSSSSSSAAAASSHAATSSAAAVPSLSADEEASARAASRPRRA